MRRDSWKWLRKSFHNMFRMRFYICAIIGLLSYTSCEQVKNKAGETIDAGAKSVGKTATDIVNSIDKGITEATAIDIEVSETLKKKGFSFGKYYVRKDAAGNENTLSLYIITESDFSQNLRLKLYDKKGVEMGRLQKNITQKSGDAKYHEFVFDDNIAFENKSKLTIE